MIKLFYIPGLWDGYDHIAGKGFIQSIVRYHAFEVHDVLAYAKSHAFN